MSLLGGWQAHFSKNPPQKIATAIGKLPELSGFGCGYDYKAYLGTQPVNGTNHAVLLEQTVFNGKDTVNAVIATYNEKPNAMDVSLIGIRPFVQCGGPMGGTKVSISLEIPKEATQALESALNGYTGSKISPVAFIGSQVVNGINYKMIAEVSPVVLNPAVSLQLITVNNLYNAIRFEPVFEISANEIDTFNFCVVNGQQMKPALGYAFTW